LNKVYQQMWLWLALALVLFGCDSKAQLDLDQPYTALSLRAISTSVAGDTLLIDLLLPQTPSKLAGLSLLFDSYGLSSQQAIVAGFDIPSIYSLEAAEQIVQNQPDLLIASDWALSPERELLYARMGIDVYMLSQPTTLVAMHHQLEELASRFGNEVEAKAATIISRAQEQEASILAKTADFMATQPASLRVLDLNSSWQSAGLDSTFHLITSMLGLENLGASLQQASAYGYAPLHIETLFVLDPDILIVDTAMYQQLRQERSFASLQAVQNNHIFLVDEELAKSFYSSTLHLLDATQALQRQIFTWYAS
jgi:ABC-type Fe3+-hydroxamate transport system substrate-binding protein